MKIFKTIRKLLVAVIVFGLMSSAHVAVAAGDGAPPIPIHPPRDPLPIPNSNVLDPTFIYNNLIVPALPPQAKEADKFELHNKPGILPVATNLGNGITLNYMNAPQPSPCVDFNDPKAWRGDVFTGYYAGWPAFAVDDGGFYRARNVVFSQERAVGPGRHYGSGYSVKVSSTQPYVAGYVGPVISVPPTAQVTVKVRYLIYNHGNIASNNQWAYDWAALGVDPDGPDGAMETVWMNGYVRGQWAEMSVAVTAGETGEIVVLLQGNSPATLNSNIYFDDVEIYVNGKAVKRCY